MYATPTMFLKISELQSWPKIILHLVLGYMPRPECVWYNLASTSTGGFTSSCHSINLLV
jgi:hypothetical protein